MESFGGVGPALAAAQLAQFCHFAREPPDQSGQQVGHRGKPAARFNQPRIEIVRPINLQLQGVQPGGGIGMAFKHVATGLGLVVRGSAPHFGKVATAAADQRPAA